MPLRFINPNYHVILIHYPLGVFILGVFLELFSFLWRRSRVRIAARFMIVAGALLTLPAATSGMYALFDVQQNQGITDARYQMLRWHVIYMGIASLLAVFCAVVALGSSDRWRRRLYFPLLLGVVGAWALMILGAWHGGETIYQQGTAVAIIKTNDGKTHIHEPQPEAPPVASLDSDSTPKEIREAKYNRTVDYYIGGSLQQHMILAGFALAFAMAALGLSMRRLNAGEAIDDDLIIEGIAAGRPAAGGRTPVRGQVGGTPRRGTDDISVIRSFNPDASIGGEVAADVPAGRFWLLTALVVLVTLVAGYWVIEGSNFLDPTHLTTFKNNSIVAKKWPFSRHQAHFYLGAAFFVLALICGLLAWIAPKRSLLLGFFGLLLVLVIAAQVWIGVLLTFDDSGHSLYHFSHGDETTTSSTSETTTSGAPATAATLPAAPEKPTRPAIVPPVPTTPATPATPPVTNTPPAPSTVPAPAHPAPAPTPPAPTPTTPAPAPATTPAPATVPVIPPLPAAPPPPPVPDAK
ncbi:MAG TPA: DUF2231 domain-containing protein [Tepidisphaeraceae bacterium]|nr:DUF2231 domain-containing protein [Tepidisphaeraceae bacterium]